MTPAVQALKKAKVWFALHPYEHQPGHENYGLEAAKALDLPEARVFKTLLVELQNPGSNMGIGILPVSARLDLKAMSAAAGVKRASMADPKDAQRVTGYVLGGISPFGQKKKLLTVIDDSALGWETIHVSGGKRGLQIELEPQTLIKLCQARTGRIVRG
jgi:Cys-tRNA(Pro)/Cys-tRNA(Cys) deacylase